jgi:4,5-dihydroxyphthalate decarboxylase
MKVPLTLACGLYDRTVALQNGTAVADGIDLNYISMRPADGLFRRQARHAEFDVAEFSLSTYVILRARGDERMVAIPVFPSRKFRHSDLYINTRKGIRKPQDLVGRRIGAQEYQQTAAVWIRGILQEEYGVRPEQVEWYFGGYNQPENYTERIPINLPPALRRVTISNRQSLNQMLEDGEIDAVMGASPPRAFIQRSPNVARLFPNFKEVETEYCRKTGIFPIMHTIVIKREIYERAPWIPVNLCLAFEKAKSIGLRRLHEVGQWYCALPWLTEYLEETTRVMGTDPFSYGLAKNRRILEKFIEYCHEQGLTERQLKVDDLMAHETLDLEISD